MYLKKNIIFLTLIHLGYLAYDRENRMVYIPNKELFKKFEIMNIINH